MQALLLRLKGSPILLWIRREFPSLASLVAVAALYVFVAWLDQQDATREAVRVAQGAGWGR